MRSFAPAGLAVGLLLAALPGVTPAATLTIQVADAPGEGFNDPTPATPVAGNPGTTLGAQRLNVFQAAAEAWGDIIESTVTIPIFAAFDPLDCDPFSGLLGGAAPRTFVSGDVLGPVWHPFALANAVFGEDVGPFIGFPAGEPNIIARFNSDVDDPVNCLMGITWWYGIGSPPPADAIDLFTTVFHEIGHGLGFTTAVDLQTGAKLNGLDDVFMVNLENHSTGELWPTMTNGERLASTVDTGDLHWVGVNAVAAGGVLSAGTHASGHIRMYAPDPFQLGSSVAHWDTALMPDEVMEPFLANASQPQDLVTTELMADIGWGIMSPGGGTCTPGATTLCLPGDDRFEVTLFFETVQGPGNMGDAQALSLDTVGITKGGILYFTDATNPEVLVKVLDGCGVNGRYWVFYAATTNIGFELTVEDTANGMTRVYTNPDINPAQTVTDTQAFATCP